MEANCFSNIRRLVFLLPFLFLLIGCGEEAQEQALPEKPQIVVHYWRHFYEPEKLQIERFIEEFEAAHPHIKIEFDSPPYSTYTTKLAAAVSAGTGPDVINIHNSWAYKYIKSGYIKPVPEGIMSTEEIEEEFFPLIQSFKYEGRYWGLPIGAGNLALFYNTRMFEGAGLDPEHPPATWEELKDAALKLTQREDGRILISGAAIGQPSHQGWNYLVEGLFRQAGSQIISSDHKIVLWNSPEGREALNFFTSFIKDLNVYSYEFLSPYEAFSREISAMMIEGNWSIGRLAIDAPDLPYRTAVLPRGKERATYGTFWANCVTKKATGEVETAAWEFISFITSAEASKAWALNVGELPMRKAVAESAELVEKEPRIAPFLEQMPYAYSSLKKEEEVYKRAITAAVEDALLKDKSAEDALNDAAVKVNEMLGGE
ncbi:MAG: hypothetical protein AMS15_07025 [Planctomycetes bacterium DG_23]|nr:MAG: hypothetical protein AMS15_07025 [Planctomycetes bacterium DG_23]